MTVKEVAAKPQLFSTTYDHRNMFQINKPIQFGLGVKNFSNSNTLYTMPKIDL